MRSCLLNDGKGWMRLLLNTRNFGAMESRWKEFERLKRIQRRTPTCSPPQRATFTWTSAHTSQASSSNSTSSTTSSSSTSNTLSSSSSSQNIIKNSKCSTILQASMAPSSTRPVKCSKCSAIERQSLSP